MTPKGSESTSCLPPPPKESFQKLKKLFWRIFKIKWPNSEEKLEFGVRLGWGPEQFPPPKKNRPAGSAHAYAHRVPPLDRYGPTPHHMNRKSKFYI